MSKTDILIIGGGPAGIVSALTAKKNYPDKSVTLVRNQDKAIVPCAIPYIFNRLKDIDQNIIPDKSLIDLKVDLKIDQATGLDTQQKKVTLKSQEEISYDKLILALGSAPHSLPIKGIEQKGAWQVKKEYQYLKELKDAVLEAKNIVIIGGGFIGVEFAEELSSLAGKKISLVEMTDSCLSMAFDPEITQVAETKLKEQGVDIYTKTSVEEIIGQEKVSQVKLSNQQAIPADLVIVSIGARPNVELAKQAGLKVEDKGAIWVDEYLKTSVEDVFAAGDCAQTKDALTGRNCPVMLASTACAEARIATINLYQIKLLRENKGTTGAYSSRLGGLVLGAAGLTEKKAQQLKVDYVVGLAKAQSRHPGKLPKSQPITVKLVFAKSSEGVLLGGQVVGPESISELTNAFVLAIQQKATAFDLETAQISTHPLCTAAPTCHPLIMAAEDALKKM